MSRIKIILTHRLTFASLLIDRSASMCGHIVIKVNTVTLMLTATRRRCKCMYIKHYNNAFPLWVLYLFNLLGTTLLNQAIHCPMESIFWLLCNLHMWAGNVLEYEYPRNFPTWNASNKRAHEELWSGPKRKKKTWNLCTSITLVSKRAKWTSNALFGKQDMFLMQNPRLCI